VDMSTVGLWRLERQPCGPRRWASRLVGTVVLRSLPRTRLDTPRRGVRPRSWVWGKGEGGEFHSPMLPHSPVWPHLWTHSHLMSSPLKFCSDPHACCCPQVCWALPYTLPTSLDTPYQPAHKGYSWRKWGQNPCKWNANGGKCGSQNWGRKQTLKNKT